jgi:ABC-2 type transport system permease protein
MSLRRVSVLFGKELLLGPRSFVFILALVVPVALTLLLSLIFGTFFSGQSRLGVADRGNSQLVALAQANPALRVSTFASAEALEDAVARGAVDLGLVLPAGFDSEVAAGRLARLSVLVWGESHLRHRIILGTAVVQGLRQIAGQAPPVEIVEEVLGTRTNISWEQRLLPLLVLMTIMMGGTLVPATSLVTEKTKRTLAALATSPATLLEVFTAKGLLGALLSVFAGLLILFLNRAFGGQPWLLVGVLALGALFSASLGVLLGTLAKDVNTLFATIKALGLFLYAPGFVYVFPGIPQWIGRLFPTYYILHPVLEISQSGAGLAEVGADVGILLGLIAVAWAVLAAMARRMQETEAAS